MLDRGGEGWRERESQVRKKLFGKLIIDGFCVCSGEGVRGVEREGVLFCVHFLYKMIR